ncbi:MAG: PmoA family protein, partial [Planctomycetes bacterium]|nr:PmoA family protein [Planctomycetota bacterium]
QIKEYHYGGMALRGSRDWYSAEAERPSASADAIPGQFLTSEGKHRRDGNHSRPDWVSTYGPTGDGQSTITVMSHPQNFRHPQPVRLHPLPLRDPGRPA